MWHDWDTAVVESDINRIKEAKLDVMRVFPMWSDFQPLRMHFGGNSSRRELRLRENVLPETEAGRAGIDEVMVERFEVLCDLAEKYDVKLIVGLITGWMSGRMHMPEAFAGLDLIKDPMVVAWQVKFVKYMVRRYKDKKAIVAWDLGGIFIDAILYAILYRKTGNCLISFIPHFLNNMIGFFLVPILFG